MAAAYGAYCGGVGRAMKLLVELQTLSTFDKFLQVSPDGAVLSDMKGLVSDNQRCNDASRSSTSR